MNISGKFRVKGNYCSFACMLADNKDYKHNSYISSLYKQLTCGLLGDSDTYIKSLEHSLDYLDINAKNKYIQSIKNLIVNKLEVAPPRSCLKMFGGKLTIEEFRNSTKERKIYKMIEYPMYVSRDWIEEIDIQCVKDINKTLFNLQDNHTNIQSLTSDKINNIKQRNVDSNNNKNKNIVINNNNINKFIFE